MPLKVWNGSSYVTASGLKVWNGSSWVAASNGYVWNGSAWVPFFSSFSPVTYTFTTAGTSSVNVPTGATQIIVECIGGGGEGGRGETDPSTEYGGSGGGGAYVKITKTLTSGDAGKTVNYTVGAGGTGGTLDGNNGVASSSTTTGFSFGNYSISAGGGGGGFYLGNGGSGGTGSGGDTDTPGTAGTNVGTPPPGGTGNSFEGGGTVYGTGGNGGILQTPPGNAGAVRIRFS